MGYFSSVIDAFTAPMIVSYPSGASAVTTDELTSLAEQEEEEGAVLLKNDDSALPLSKDVTKVNVFGWASSDWLGGGSGSGDVKETKVDLNQALKSYGIQTNDELAKMYESFAGQRKYSGTLYCYPWQSSRLYEPAIDDESCYTPDILANAKDFSDTAIVVLGRLYGESSDLTKQQYKVTKAGASDKDVDIDDTRTTLDISSEEESLLSYVGANYEHVVVIVNSGDSMALGRLDAIPGVDAVLSVGYTGEYAANAIPRLLWGDVCPSGKTNETWAYDLSTNPSYANSGLDGTGSYSNGKGLYPYDGTLINTVGTFPAYDRVSYVDYSEGIYVGYKWYETADAEGYWDDVSNEYGTGYDGVVQYPFGYGLSYTTFSWEVTSHSRKIAANGDISCTVKVTNTGSVAGKDVVELYYSPPYYSGGIEKSAVELGAFAKTDTLAPGESQEVTLSFPVYDMASYDCYDANHDGFSGYELESGDYVFTLRHDAHTVDSADGSTATISLAETIQYPDDPSTGEAVTNEFTGDSAADGVSVDGAEQGVRYLSRADFKDTFPKSSVESREMPDDVKALNLYTSADADAEIDPNATEVTTGASNGLQVEIQGKTTELGYQLGFDYEDPEWDPLLDQLTTKEMTTLYTTAFSESAVLPSVGKEESHEVDGPQQIGGFTDKGTGVGFPNACVLAQTWDQDLAHQLGLEMGSNALSLGYSGWYAPGINIKRSPLGGRNYEYYSEDTMLTAYMSGNVEKGSLDAGVFCYVKHLICDDTESGYFRDGVYVWETEQALRETYLEPFRIVVEEFGGTGIMTAYNRIGAVWAGGSKALLTNVLRGEWGFQGAVVTDFSDHPKYMNGDQALRAGGSLWMVVGGSLAFETSSNTYMGHLREATHQVLYMYLNARDTNAVFVDSAVGNARWARPDIRKGFNPIYTIASLIALAIIVWLVIEIRIVRRERRAAKALADDSPGEAEKKPDVG